MILFGAIPLGARPDGSWPTFSLPGRVADEVNPVETAERHGGRNPLLVLRGLDAPAPAHDDPELYLLLHVFLETIQ